MENPVQRPARSVAHDTFVLPAWVPVPGLGVLSMSSFLIRGEQPVLVDCGPAILAEDLIRELSAILDPEDLAWIWLTHTDPDHIGALERILELAPRARVVTTFLGLGKLGLHTSVGPERAYLLNPGGELDVGDRQLRALRPPVFDAPETLAAVDSRTGALFAADCFGTLLSDPREDSSAIDSTDLTEGMLTWASIDAPWLQGIDPRAFRRSLASIVDLAPEVVLGSHLPPASGDLRRLVASLSRAPGLQPFEGPDQVAIEAMSAA